MNSAPTRKSSHLVLYVVLKTLVWPTDRYHRKSVQIPAPIEISTAAATTAITVGTTNLGQRGSTTGRPPAALAWPGTRKATALPFIGQLTPRREVGSGELRSAESHGHVDP